MIINKFASTYSTKSPLSGSAHDNQDTVFTIEDLDPDIDEFGYPLDPLDGEEGEDGGQRRRSITNGNSKDDPLDRRALLSLEKQLVLEEPESEFDLHVSFYHPLKAGFNSKQQDHYNFERNDNLKIIYDLPV